MLMYKSSYSFCLAVNLICFVLILENIGLAELQKGVGGQWEEKEKERKKKNASFSVSKIFVQGCHRKTTPANGSNAL